MTAKKRSYEDRHPEVMAKDHMSIKSRIDALKEAIKAGTAPAMTKDVRRLLERSIARESGSAWCRNCGRGLTDPESVRLGIGPECRKPFDTRKTKP